MIEWWWSYLLSLFGAIGFLLSIRGYKFGLWMGLGNQALWVTYTIGSGQNGFWFSVALFTGVNLYGLCKWEDKDEAN